MHLSIGMVWGAVVSYWCEALSPVGVNLNDCLNVISDKRACEIGRNNYFAGECVMGR